MRGNSALSEVELLRQFQSGDDHAFTEIYTRYWEKLLAIGLYYTHDKQAAEDIVHDVMISLWNRRDEVTITSLEAYLATAVKFAVFKSMARDKKRRQILSNKELSGCAHDIEGQLEARFLEELLHRTVEKLPEKARIVFTYSRDQKLTVSEIARKMDLTPKAVEYHMTKALRSLRKALIRIKSLFV